MTEKISSLVIDTVDSRSSAGGSSTLRLICNSQIGPKNVPKNWQVCVNNSIFFSKRRMVKRSFLKIDQPV